VLCGGRKRVRPLVAEADLDPLQGPRVTDAADQKKCSVIVPAVFV
jgi:hypothetical protein